MDRYRNIHSFPAKYLLTFICLRTLFFCQRIRITTARKDTFT